MTEKNSRRSSRTEEYWKYGVPTPRYQLICDCRHRCNPSSPFISNLMSQQDTFFNSEKSRGGGQLMNKLLFNNKDNNKKKNEISTDQSQEMFCNKFCHKKKSEKKFKKKLVTKKAKCSTIYFTIWGTKLSAALEDCNGPPEGKLMTCETTMPSSGRPLYRSTQKTAIMARMMQYSTMTDSTPQSSPSRPPEVAASVPEEGDREQHFKSTIAWFSSKHLPIVQILQAKFRAMHQVAFRAFVSSSDRLKHRCVCIPFETTLSPKFHYHGRRGPHFQQNWPPPLPSSNNTHNSTVRPSRPPTRALGRPGRKWPAETGGA